MSPDRTEMRPVKLGVNLDHVATLRQLRAGTVNYPDLLAARDLAVLGGADQITVHLRGDRRHIQYEDLVALGKTRGKTLLNLEMAATDEMTQVALEVKPSIVCLVPEKREELTTEGGLDAVRNQKAIENCISHMKKNKIAVSLFIETDQEQIKMAHELAADAVEFHTGHFATAKGPEQEQIFKQLCEGANAAHDYGIKVHAGHGLNYNNTQSVLSLPYLEELNIGHAIICRSIFVGLTQAVKEMKQIIMGDS